VKPKNINGRTLLESYRQEIARCVKCGACRPVCPTFLHSRAESLSPRGRMALVRAVLDGRLPVSKIYQDRLATCTTCLACESVCPNNVPVTTIIQCAKEQAVAESGRGSWAMLSGDKASACWPPVLLRAPYLK
jgi:glycolate oxidase iron-sulfur subunit